MNGDMERCYLNMFNRLKICFDIVSIFPSIPYIKKNHEA